MRNKMILELLSWSPKRWGGGIGKDEHFLMWEKKENCYIEGEIVDGGSDEG